MTNQYAKEIDELCAARTKGKLLDEFVDHNDITNQLVQLDLSNYYYECVVWYYGTKPIGWECVKEIDETAYNKFISDFESAKANKDR